MRAPVLLSALACLAFLATSYAAALLPFVVLIPNQTQNVMTTLVAKGLDVRGYFGGQIVLFEAPENLLKISENFPEAMFIGVAQPKAYIVVEGDCKEAGWADLVSQISNSADHRILFEDCEMILLGVYSRETVEFSQKFSLPRTAEYIALPDAPIKLTTIQENHPMNRKVVKPHASVAQLVAAVNEADLREFALYLSGEGSGSSLRTRHSSSQDAVRSGEWAIEVFESYGFNATSNSFGNNYCPNIIAELRGTTKPDQVVVLGAHLDCRNQVLSDSANRAPGANDDGSGSAAILQIAKAISAVKATFKTTVRLALFCGEEQGLVGSRAYAAALSRAGENIVGMIQADMIGYQAYSEPQCAFVNRYTDATFTSFARDVATLYVPEIAQVTTSACCSDHQSFYEQGFPSVGLVEGGGYTIDPQYHNVADTVNRSGYSLLQMQGITRVMIATAAEIAEIN